MQLKNNGKGVKIGQRVGLSYCDELKIRRFYSEPNIKGDKKCKLWTLRSVILGMWFNAETSLPYFWVKLRKK